MRTVLGRSRVLFALGLIIHLFFLTVPLIKVDAVFTTTAMAIALLGAMIAGGAIAAAVFSRILHNPRKGFGWSPYFLITLAGTTLCSAIKYSSLLYLDARPSATFHALLLPSRRAFFLRLYWQTLSMLGLDTFQAIYYLNLVVGWLGPLFIYLLCVKTFRRKGLATIVALSLCLHPVFWQATVSSEYFLVQFLFAAVLLLSLRIVNRSPAWGLVLYYCSFTLLYLSKHEMSGLAILFPILTLGRKWPRVNHRLLFGLFLIFSFLLGQSAVAVSSSAASRQTIYENSAYYRMVALHGDWAALLFFPVKNLIYLFRHFTVEVIAAALVLLWYQPTARRRFDTGWLLLLYAPTAAFCFVIHMEGLIHQEGGLKFSYQLLFPLTYLYAVALYHVLERGSAAAWRRRGATAVLLIIATLFAVREYRFLAAYLTETERLAAQPYLTCRSKHPALILTDNFVEKVFQLSRHIDKLGESALIIDYSQDRFIFDYLISKQLPRHRYDYSRGREHLTSAAMHHGPVLVINQVDDEIPDLALAQLTASRPNLHIVYRERSVYYFPVTGAEAAARP